MSEVTSEVTVILHDGYRFPVGQSEVYSREPECDRFWVGLDPVPDQLQIPMLLMEIQLLANICAGPMC